jgi:hypothetical protein
MPVGPQLVGVAGLLLKNVTRLVPWVAPKLVPAMVMLCPIAPELGVRLVMVGGGTNCSYRHLRIVVAARYAFDI